MSILEAALKYAELGFSVIPVKPAQKGSDGKDENKKAIIKWEPFQKTPAQPELIKQWWKKWPDARIGIVCGSVSDLSVVDCDSEEAKKKVDELLPDSLLIPMARTPRGGYHLWFKNNSKLITKAGVMPNVDIRAEGGMIIAPPSSGINGNGYSWIIRLNGRGERPSIPSELLSNILSSYSYSLYSKELSTKIGATKELQNATKRNIDFNEGSRDESIFHIANLLVKGGGLKEETEQLLTLIGTKICNPPFPLNEIKAKVDSAIDRARKRDRNLTQEVRDIVSATSGNISVTFLAKELQSATKEERSKLRTVVSRLVVDGILEPTKRVAGEYRIVNKEYDVIDLMKIEQGNVADVRLPFRIESLVEIYPKDLIVFAGAPNTGKTALMLETVRLNMDRWKCWYFSTEMGRFNARDRIAKHMTCKEWKFNFIDDVPNYLDVLHPDDLNFIDYVETGTEGDYFKIPGVLGAIQKRMRNGIVFVALQKKSNVAHALGGEQTKAKCSIFCGIDSDYPGAVIRLEKVKNFKGANPNGYLAKFAIKGGINIEQRTEWQPEY